MLFILLNRKHREGSEVFQSLSDLAFQELLSPGWVQMNCTEKANLGKSARADS